MPNEREISSGKKENKMEKVFYCNGCTVSVSENDRYFIAEKDGKKYRFNFANKNKKKYIEVLGVDLSSGEDFVFWDLFPTQ